ncbi:MAG: tetratricopeptide repeat protein, partial [Bacteroidetes bacterium]|nr:tetratricopeptide repeat protein [Bacteroidota bacterium]
DAELHYRRALDAAPNTPIPKYNLGLAQSAQGQLEEGTIQFKESAELFTLASDKAEAYHNMGNALLLQEKYEESIEAFKKALKISPNDMDTKYNLAYAQLMLKKEQQQEQQNQDQNQDQQENQDKQDQNQDQENKDEKDPNQDKGEEKEDKKDGNSDKENQEEDKGDKKEEPGKDPSKQEQNKPKEAKLSKEQAEQLLKALENQEAKLQEKLDEPEGEAVKIFIEKDW